MTPDEVAKAVDGYKVLRHQGQVFVQPRDDAEMIRLQNLGAACTSAVVRGGVVRECVLHPMLDEPTETDDDGTVIDNRREIMLSYFRERDGWPESYPGRTT